MEKTKKSYETGIVKRTVMINVPKEKVWRKVSNIAGLSEWVTDVKKTTYLSKQKKGVGTVRKITFNDGNTIEEHIVAWNPKESFTYAATEGLPLRIYIATISITAKAKKKTRVTWQSYINSKKMTKNQFRNFLEFMGSFYEESLNNLRGALEK